MRDNLRIAGAAMVLLALSAADALAQRTSTMKNGCWSYARVRSSRCAMSKRRAPAPPVSPTRDADIGTGFRPDAMAGW